MQKRITVLLVTMLALGSLVTVFQPDCKASTNERNWLVEGTDITFGDGIHDGLLYGPVYLRVNASDIVTINWKTGTTPSQFFLVEIGLDTPAVNYSQQWTEGVGSQYPFGAGYLRVYTGQSNWWGGAAPHSEWIQISSYDILYLDVYSSWSPTPQIINVTVQHAPNNMLNNIALLQNQINNLTMNMTNTTAELNMTKVQLNLLSNQLSQLSLNESSDYTKVQTLIESLNSSLGQNITDLWNALGENDTNLMNQLVSKITNLTDQLSLLNSTLNEEISGIPKYNDTPIWDELNTIKQPINATYLNQTLVNQTIVNKTEVQPLTYMNKTIENPSKPDYLISAIAGIIGGIIGGFIIATILIRRQKPEVVYMKDVTPPEALKEQMMNVRKLQSQGAEAEVTTEDNEKGK